MVFPVTTGPWFLSRTARPLPSALATPAAQSVAADQRDRIGVNADFAREHRAGLAVGFHRVAGARKRHRIGRMRVDNAVDVGARLENLGMDVDLAVAARGAGDDIAFEIDGEDVLHGDLVETQAVRLHEEQFWIAGHAHRNVAAGEIVLTLGDQHFAGYDKLLLDGGMRFFLHRPALHFALLIGLAALLRLNEYGMAIAETQQSGRGRARSRRRSRSRPKRPTNSVASPR